MQRTQLVEALVVPAQSRLMPQRADHGRDVEALLAMDRVCERIVAVPQGPILQREGVIPRGGAQDLPKIKIHAGSHPILAVAAVGTVAHVLAGLGQNDERQRTALDRFGLKRRYALDEVVQLPAVDPLSKGLPNRGQLTTSQRRMGPQLAKPSVHSVLTLLCRMNHSGVSAAQGAFRRTQVIYSKPRSFSSGRASTMLNFNAASSGMPKARAISWVKYSAGTGSVMSICD